MMTPHEKISAINALTKALGELIKMPTTTECADCKFSDAGGVFCNKYKEPIPDDVRITGCEVWEFNPDAPPF